MRCSILFLSSPRSKLRNAQQLEGLDPPVEGMCGRGQIKVVAVAINAHDINIRSRSRISSTL
jgi:hypothetical protein